MEVVEKKTSRFWLVIASIILFLAVAPVCLHETVPMAQVDKILMTGLSGPARKLSKLEKEKVIQYFKNKVEPQVGPVEAKKLANDLVVFAEAHGLSPRFILAVIHIESRFNLWAVSPVGAMGLLQIMPETGQWLVEKLGLSWQGNLSLFDPHLNLRLGIAYLAMLRDRYGDDMKAVLSAYNAGPGNFEKGRQKGKGYQLGYYSKVRSFLVSQLE
jgi:soluble lytic murein transglycosylase-like protein